jgi:VWFA-related protein
MRFLSWAAVLFCTCALIAENADDQPVTPPIFTVRVNTVSIDVEVLDKDGYPVLGLDQSDFVVKENGREVKISNFSRWTDRPVSLAIILDTSTIKLDMLSVAKEHIMQMLHIFDGKDELSLFSFDNRNAWLEAERSHDKKQIIDALDNISVPSSRRRGSGGMAEYFSKLPYTALAIDKALLHIEKSPVQRKALLVISNRFRNLGPATVDHIRDSECTLFTLAFTNKTAALATILGDRISKNQFMRDSGGRSFSAENEDIPETSRTLVSTLKNYYSIGYQAEVNPGDKKRRRIEVNIPGKKYVINARRFYTPNLR